MESADDSSISIYHQYRYAIGGEDSEYDSWHVSDHPVADSTHAIVVRADRVDAIAVNLLQARKTHPRVSGMPACPVGAYRVGVVAHAFS